VACWSTKAAISLKRVKIYENLLSRAYRKSPTLFRTVPSPIPYGLLFFQDWGFAHPPKTSIAIISGTGKATDFQFGRYIHRVHVHPNKSPLKFWRKGSVGVSRDCPNLFGYPLLSQELVKLRTSNLAGTFTGPSKQKSIKILEKRERGRIQGLSRFFRYPLLSQERVKLRTSISQSIINFGKSSRGRSQGLPKIFRASVLGRIARSSLRNVIVQLSCFCEAISVLILLALIHLYW